MKNNEIIESKELRESMIDQVGVLEKVKDLLLLGNSEYATVKQVADYYEVSLETIQSLVKNNREELTSNGLYNLTGKETKELLAMSSYNIANFKGYFTVDGQKMNNRNNLLFQKRTILNVGMLLTESKVAEEVRRRLLDIEHESNNAVQENGKTVKENIVSEIDEEKDLMISRVEAEMSGDYDKVCVINAKLFALKNKRIEELEKEVETITTNSLTIIESKKVINRLTRVIATKEYKGRFANAYTELYSMVNYKLGINIKARDKKSNQSYLDTLNEEEMFKVENIVRTWANELGINVQEQLKL